ncbi:MAG: HPr(Ser) kinase/phosphatase [Lachnospiraceae bacterium]|nr:HPr(Ser) kinase/phosphatase [Lachnospiraceae bacterium]
MATIRLSEVVEKMKLTNMTPEVDVNKIKIRQPDVNRPAIQLTGYLEHFEATRIQIIGLVEHAYMESMDEDRKERILRELLSMEIPCFIFCRSLMPDEMFIRLATENNIALLVSKQATSTFTAELIRWLNVRLAPCISIHGVLVDVYGVGVLITGESGIGKSETALELIKRGHRLVSDDVVEIRRVSEVSLVGSAPAITKHFIELRGIGIVDVKALFGASSVRNMTNIDLVIQMEEWSKDKEYDRLGLEEEHTEFLGIPVVCHRIPIRPGRNLALICEAAAVNHRQKEMGYNAAQELYKRVQESLSKRRSDDEDE